MADSRVAAKTLLLVCAKCPTEKAAACAASGSCWIKAERKETQP